MKLRPKKKKETRGGARINAGAKPKYNEQTKTVAFRCPLSKKVKAISSSLEGTKVKPKYQKQYGKRYDKAEATEAATKIAGAMTAKERRKSILSKYKK